MAHSYFKYALGKDFFRKNRQENVMIPTFVVWKPYKDYKINNQLNLLKELDNVKEKSGNKRIAV